MIDSVPAAVWLFSTHCAGAGLISKSQTSRKFLNFDKELADKLWLTNQF